MSKRILISLLSLLVGCSGAFNDVPPPHSTVLMAMSGNASGATSDGSVTIPGYRSNYSVVRSDSGTVTLINKLTSEVTSYNGIKLLKFFDKYTSFDISGPSGQVYRLYQAAFNRKPDQVGIGFWIKSNLGGYQLSDIANGFIQSTEFQSLYGKDAPATTFITTLYNNILHRAPEQAGYSWWVDQVNAGVSRSEALLSFADSPENKAALQADMQNGFDYVPFQPGGPIVPQGSSYENAKNIGMNPIHLPNHWTDQSIRVIEPNEVITSGFALGDFFQDGNYSLVAFTNNFVPQGQPNYGRAPGHVYFYKKDSAGNWVDHTADILQDQTGCITPRKVIVADFNGDGKPDVFAACHGSDLYPLPVGYTVGEHPRMLLSQQNGSYKNVDMGFTCYCHGAAAADVNTRGYADIIVTDPAVSQMPYFLINNHDGTFAADKSRIAPAVNPFSFPGQTQTYSHGIFSAELIDIFGTGKYDLWLGGVDDKTDTGFASSIFRNSGTNTFTDRIILPSVPVDTNSLDIVFDQGNLYMLRVNDQYSEMLVQKIALATMATSVIFTHNTEFGNGSKWIDWLIPKGNALVPMNSAYSVTIPK